MKIYLINGENEVVDKLESKYLYVNDNKQEGKELRLSDNNLITKKSLDLSNIKAIKIEGLDGDMDE